MNAAVMAAALLLAAGRPAMDAKTYYVRVDGGTPGQCDGLHDAPYRRGKGRACAWRHPFDALPPGGKPRIAGGDTLVIGAGQYMIGLGAPGTAGNHACYAAGAWDCMAAPVPAGPSPQRPTRILGAGYDSGCAQPPQLWGTERVGSVLDLRGSSNVEIACLDITDHSDCIEFHCHGGDCKGPPGEIATCGRDQPPFGAWASTGIRAADAHDVVLRDLDIHGLAHTGISAGRVRDWRLERVRIRANGWVGWDGDIGKDDSSNAGTLRFSDVEIAWNGCGERYPGGAIFGCWAQEEGGYGDGLGTARTGGDWFFDRVRVHDNTSDGIDLLYADGSGRVVVTDSQLWNNAGNQLKVRGAAEVRGSTVVGSCSAARGRGHLRETDLCRAAGNALVVAVGEGRDTHIERSDLRGAGDCVLEFGCSGQECRVGSSVEVSGNLIAALGGGPKRSCLAWIEPKLRGASVTFRDNRVYGVRKGNCPEGASTCSHQVDAPRPAPPVLPAESAKP